MPPNDRSCRWICRRLPLLVGGELVGSERRKVERHLIVCSACHDRSVALKQSLTLLQGVAGDLPARGGTTLSVWPALARQIRESRHDSAPRPTATWLPLAGRPGTRRVGLYGLAASLILGGIVIWNLRPPTPVLSEQVAQGPAAAQSLGAGAGRARSIAVAPDEATSSESMSMGSIADYPERFESLVRPSRPSAPALPMSDASRGLATNPPSADPFQPPLTLRYDYDLDRGTLSGPSLRDTQRAY